METNTKRSRHDYSLAFKLGVVDQVENGEITYKQAQERYAIQGSSTVLVWLRKHGRLDWSKDSNFHHRKIPMSDPSVLTPEQRIRELEQQLVETKRKAEFFEAVVEVLKRDYGVSLVKKPRGKRSGKNRP